MSESEYEASNDGVDNNMNDADPLAAAIFNGTMGHHQAIAEHQVRAAPAPNVQPPLVSNVPYGQQGRVQAPNDCSASVVSANAAPHEQGANFVVPHQDFTHVRHMPGYSEGGMQKLGDGIKAQPPEVNQVASNGGGWVDYQNSNVQGMVPARAMCINVPLELFSTDASSFKDWQTPVNNAIRAASVAALLGMIYTPLSKGMVSGMHEENARMRDAEDPQNKDDKEKKSAKPVDSVKWYQMQNPNAKTTNVPMLLIGVEDIYNDTRTVVLALRIWHFIFDHSHSTSELAHKLMNESYEEFVHSGSAHCQNSKRRVSVVTSAKATQTLLGTSLESTKLEEAAGMCYRHVTNLSDLKKLLAHYGGKTSSDEGRQPVDLEFDKENPHKTPIGLLNRPLVADPHLGCTHPLGFEWVFNAKRPEALIAGLVHLDGSLMDVHPDQVNVSSYFPGDAAVATFQLPSWVASSDRVGSLKGKGCFAIQSDPFKLNVFDMTFPHPVAGLVRPGRNLLTLYRKRFLSDTPNAPDIDSPKLVNMLQNFVTERDAYIQEQVAAWTNSVVSFDTFNCSAEQRHDAKVKKSAALQGVTTYGQQDDGALVVEPRRVLKEHSFASNQLYDKLLAPYFEEEESRIAGMEQAIRDIPGNEDIPEDDPLMKPVIKANNVFHLQKRVLMKELIVWHLSKMQRSFTSKVDQQAIPVGYRAVWDGLEGELQKMKSDADVGVSTANVAQALNMNLCSSDRSVFGQLENWLWTFMEEDCYIDGRGWSTMQELFYHCFEQFGPTTLLLIVCGSKGTGKTLRTERLMKAFVDGWMTMAGPSSAKAGMHGDGGSTDGTNCFYDEMIDELTDGDGSNRTEYWKMILLKREYVYLKTAVMKGSDGVERHKTFKLITPHQETHIVCTNRGPAFTKGTEEPSEVKAALIDRSNFKVVCAQGGTTHDDAEFEANMRRPETNRKRRAFRILTCLTALLKMLIYRQSYLQPDLSFAQKLFDEWDKEVDEKYGLPRLSPRKNIKRIENLITMCCLNAVAHVFFYKQVACTTQAGRVDAEFPNGRPFKIEMLYECTQLLQPTREMIHRAWTMGLEYGIGTSSMGTTTMTAVAENIGMQIGSFFKVPSEDYTAHQIHRHQLVELLESDRIRRERKEAGQLSVGAPPNSALSELYDFDSYFPDVASVIKEEDLKKSRDFDRMRREARMAYQLRCSKNSGLSRKMNIMSLVDNSLLQSNEATETPETTGSLDDEEEVQSAKQRGRELYEQQQEPCDLIGESAHVIDGYHEARSAEFRGKKFCTFNCCTAKQQQNCWYCSWEVEESIRKTKSGDKMSIGASLIWPTLLDGALFYKPQTLVQMASDSIAEVDAGCGQMGNRRFLSGFAYKKKKIGDTGASRVDIGWVQATTDPFTSWRKAADYMVKSGNTTVSRFGFYTECLSDTMWLLASKENARRCAEEPRLEHKCSPDYALQDSDGKGAATESHRYVRVRPYAVNGDTSDTTACTTHKAQPRHTRSGISQRDFQRRFDSLLQGGRLCALNILVSPRITTVAPVRMHHEGLEVNVSAMYNHVSLVAEMVKALSSVPGLKNMQEAFSNSKQGPVGLAADRTKLSSNTNKTQVVSILAPQSNPEGTASQSNPEGTASQSTDMDVGSDGPREEGEPHDPSTKRGRAEPLADNFLHKLPYSIDVVPMGLAFDMAGMLYDDRGADFLNGYKAKFESYGSELKQADLPHLSTSFVGYASTNRQTISVKLNTSPREGQKQVAASDPDISTVNVSRTHVSCSIGREATDEDIEKWVARRQGARSTGQLEGDLFAFSTWMEHTLTTMRKRGVIASENDAAFRTCIDMEHLIGVRVLELACENEDQAWASKFNIDLAHVQLKRPKPSTYKALDKETDSTVHLKRKKLRVNKVKISYGERACIPIEPQEDGLWGDEDGDMDVVESDGRPVVAPEH